MKTRIIICFILLLNFYAFSQKKAQIPTIKKERTGNPISIDVYSAYKEKKVLGISTIADDIEFIPLETTNDCLLDGTLKNIIVTESDIFVFDYNLGYRFSRKGKFINFIGSKGQGPKEFIKPMHMEVDTINHLVYFLDHAKIIKYNYDGKHIETISTGTESNQFLITEPGQFEIDNRYYVYSKPNERFSVFFFSEKEKKIISRFSCDYKGKIPRMAMCDPIAYKYNNNIYLKDFWCDTIYRMNGFLNAISYAVIDKGSFRNRILDNTRLTTGKATTEESMILEFIRISESSRFILSVSNHGAIIYDKKIKTTFMGDFIKEEGSSFCFHDDLYGGAGFLSNTFPNWVRGDEIHTYGHLSKFSLDKKHLINDSRYEKYKNMIKGKDPEDNQIIMIIKLKQ